MFRDSAWSPPSLVVYTEREDRPDSWLDKAETFLTSWPTSIYLRARNLRVHGFVNKVNGHETYFQSVDDNKLLEIADTLRISLREEKFKEATVAFCFALVRETVRRKLGLRQHDSQIRGGYALLHNRVIEMDTGEGKTLTATLAVVTAALAGIPVHLVTVNDYLAGRDATSMGVVYHALGLRVGTIQHEMQAKERRAAYYCDITYVSNKEIAFDYLRDRLVLGNKNHNIKLKIRKFQQCKHDEDSLVMRGLHFAIIDEADSVLIDEARTPLIISRQTDAEEERSWAEIALGMARDLEAEVDFQVLKEDRRINLTKQGCEHLVELGEQYGGIWRSRIRREESTRQALSALHLFQRDDHYLVHDGKVQIIDEYSGRVMADRSWSDGLHQLVELKEACEITSRKIPMARMTYQRFFKRYHRLSGMTGTAKEVSTEFWDIYRLSVVFIQPHHRRQRYRFPTKIYASLDHKWQAIVERTNVLHKEGRPVLIGTRSVLASETVSAWLKKAGLEHVVLNASQDHDEAEIIASAGVSGHITVATNLAGRGVDISLDADVIELGGLHVILSEKHDARRIDRQLEGRCGRQGDPGSTEAILSFEDSLLDLVKPDSFLRLSVRQGWSGLALFYWAQRRAEQSHARARYQLMNQDRKLGSLLAFSGGME